MSEIYYFQRYSSRENAVTNNTLLLIERIYKYSNQQAAKLLNEITGESIEIGLKIRQQVRGESSVPDGSILQGSLKILIESKVDSEVSDDQLIKHARSFSNEPKESKKILLLLTKQKVGEQREGEIAENIKREDRSIIFKNVTYEGICKSLEGLFKEYEYDIKEIADDYIAYCDDENLIDDSKYLMRILPCGQSVGINKKYGIYFHESYRGYRKHSYIGIYNNKEVQYIWEIDSVIDGELVAGKLKKTIVDGRKTDEYDAKLIAIIKEAKEECGYEISSGHRFFCGKEVYETSYKKSSPGGIQGPRFVNLKELIGDYGEAREIALKLKGLTWE